MLISYSHNFLFVHIAKTGGTSVREALRPYRWSRRYTPALLLASFLSQSTRPRHALGVRIPRHAKVIAAQQMLPAELFERFFKFVFVRNPWDLEVSAYHHMLRLNDPVMAGIQTFDDFLRLKFDPERAHHFLLDASAEPQWEYLVDLRGNILVDFIGRYEQLETDFQTICNRIGIAAPNLPHRRHAEGRRDYRDYYSDWAAEKVASECQRDIELLDYRF